MGPGWQLQTVIADNSDVGRIARKHAADFAYKTQYYPYYQVNVSVCDGAVLFGNPDGARYLSLQRELRRLQKPTIENPTVAELQDFILKSGVTKLFVYGPNTKPVREQVDTVLQSGLLPF
jgi:hypothetical protein